MKAGMLFTGTGPILIWTKYDSLEDPRVIKLLDAKGIHKFIAFEIPVEVVKEKYGVHFAVTKGDLKQTDELRVVDYEGLHIFNAFPFELMQGPIYHQEEVLMKAA